MKVIIKRQEENYRVMHGQQAHEWLSWTFRCCIPFQISPWLVKYIIFLNRFT